MALLHLQTPRSSRLRFLAGQSVTLRVGDAFTRRAAGRQLPVRRPQHPVPCAALPGKLFSDYVFDRLKPSEASEIEGPEGEFVLQEKITRPLYFFAFDTGFAPVKSLIEHAMSLEPDGADQAVLDRLGREQHLPAQRPPRLGGCAGQFPLHPSLVAGHDLSNLTQVREAALRSHARGNHQRAS